MSQTNSVASMIEKLGEVILVPRHMIRPFLGQPREYFDPQKMSDLAASIKTYGQKVPGFVKEISGNGCPQKYELIDGQRRWHAIAMAGLDKMKVIVTDVKDAEEQFLISVVSNFGRAEHTPLEIAKAIQRFRNNGMTVVQIAEVFARSSVWVYTHLKVFQLTAEVQQMMSPEIPEEDRLGFSAALMLADVPLDLQKKIADTIVGEKMKVTQARSLIRRRAEKMGFKVGDPKRTPVEDYKNLCRFVGRIKRELEIFEGMPQSFIDKMFQFREEEDHDKIVVNIQNNIEKMESLLKAVKRAKKKKMVLV